MRIALVTDGFSPHARSCVAHQVVSLAAAFARLGHEVEVFASRVDDEAEAGTLDREERAAFAVTWVATSRDAHEARDVEDARVADAFEGWLVEHAIDVVHFEPCGSEAPRAGASHSERGSGLNAKLADRAARRAIPSVVTAHDFSLISPRPALLAPDLTPLDPGDTRFLARCDLADRFLERRGVASTFELSASDRVALDALLRGDPRQVGVSEDEFRAAVRARRALELARRETARDPAIVLATSEFLARRLRGRGISAEVDLPGVDVEPFARTAPPRTSRIDGPVRFGFLGELVPANGVHVLLDAFEGLAGECELSIHGDSSDTYYIERLVIHASRVGARMEGPYDAHAASERLEAFDVLVVPSLGAESAPLAIREAFAAHRPAIASRVGAMEESVRDGVDGLLVTPNNPNALRAALRRCIDEEGLVASLAERIQTPRSIDDRARGLVERYAQLRESYRRAASSTVAPSLPASVQPFAERWKRIEAHSAADLVAASIAGLARLRTSLTGNESEASPEVDLLRAIEGTRLARGARARADECARLTQMIAERDAALRASEERARQLEAKIESLTTDRAESETTRAGLEREIAELRTRAENAESHSRWMVDKHQSSERARVALERSGSEQAAEIESLRAERSSLVGEREARDAEIAWLRSVDVQRVAELEWARGERTANETELKDLRRALHDLRASSDARVEGVETRLREAEARVREAELRGEESIAHGERLAQRIEQLERELSEANAECARRAETIADREREIHARSAEVTARDTEAASLHAQVAARDSEIESLKWDTDFLARENAWREREMDAVRESLSALQFKFVGRALRERARAWTLREKRARRGETSS